MTNTSKGQAAIYTQAYQAGSGKMTNRANKKAKKHRVLSRVGDVSDALGTTNYLNNKSNGLFGKVVKKGRKHGYGKSSRMVKRH